MAKKSTGPNIPGFAIAFRGNKKVLSHKIKGCDGRIVQVIRRGNADRPVGRAFCQKCSCLVGKKLWYQLLEQMNDRFTQPLEGYIRCETHHNRDLQTKRNIWYRYFFRRQETKLELPISLAEAKRLQGFLDRVSPTKLREIVSREAPELADVVNKLFTQAAALPDPPGFVAEDARRVRRLATKKRRLGLEPLLYAEEWGVQDSEPEPQPYPGGFVGPQVNTIERPTCWSMRVGGCHIEFSKGLFEIDDIVKFENGARGLAAKFHVDHLKDLMQALADEITDESGVSPVQALWRKQGLLVLEELPAPELVGSSALIGMAGGWVLHWKDVWLTLPETYVVNDAEFFKAEVDGLPPLASHEDFKNTITSVVQSLREEGHPNFFLCQHQPTLRRPLDYFLEEDPVPEGNEDIDF